MSNLNVAGTDICIPIRFLVQGDCLIETPLLSGANVAMDRLDRIIEIRGMNTSRLEDVLVACKRHGVKVMSKTMGDDAIKTFMASLPGL